MQKLLIDAHGLFGAPVDQVGHDFTVKSLISDILAHFEN